MAASDEDFEDWKITQWGVVWSPLGGDRESTYDTEDYARRRYRELKDMGHSPILLKREVIRTPWELVENSVDVDHHARLDTLPGITGI